MKIQVMMMNDDEKIKNKFNYLKNIIINFLTFSFFKYKKK